jgi:hypothetical protein
MDGKFIDVPGNSSENEGVVGGFLMIFIVDRYGDGFGLFML